MITPKYRPAHYWRYKYAATDEILSDVATAGVMRAPRRRRISTSPARDALSACSPISQEFVDRLASLGVSIAPLVGEVLLAQARIKILKSGQFELNPSSPAVAIITPIRVDSRVPPTSIECLPEGRAAGAPVAKNREPAEYVIPRRGSTIDLVAWHPSRPENFATLLGIATILGVVRGPQDSKSAPVRVHRGVLGWFRAGCSGIVMLSQDPAVRFDVLHQIGGKIIAEDDEHETLLRKWAQPPIRSIKFTKP